MDLVSSNIRIVLEHSISNRWPSKMDPMQVIAFCVLGCAYNYSVQQKRGEDIVPGIGPPPP